MKTINLPKSRLGFLTLLALLMSVCMYSQAPALIPYQAIARDAAGQPLANTAINAKFTIHDNSATGTSVWQEIQTVNTNTLGLFTAQLGSSIALSSVNWGSGAKFMQVEIDLGNGFVDIGTQQMLSVPYALYADSAALAGNGISHIGPFGDTLFFNNGNFLIVPGVGLANTNANSSFGCTDIQACNYSANAVIDNNTCHYFGGYCNDNDNQTINDTWSIDCNCTGIITALGASHYCGAQNLHNQSLSYGTMTDQDGNLYKTITIGNQEWMAENLRVTHYRNGSAIPEGNLDSWSTGSNGRWINVSNDSIYNCPYGLIYNRWAATNTSSICPFGWHIPSDNDWTTLINFIDPTANGGSSNNNAGGPLKSAGTFFWTGTNTGGSNSTGFSAIPSGYITACYNCTDNTAYFSSLGVFGYYWSSSQTGTGLIFNRIFGNSTSSVTKSSSQYNDGLSIRCLRD